MASLAGVRVGWMKRGMERWIGSISEAVRMAKNVSSSSVSAGIEESKSGGLAYSTTTQDKQAEKQEENTEKRKFKKLTKVAGRILLEVEQRAVAARGADGRTGPRDIIPGDILEVKHQLPDLARKVVVMKGICIEIRRRGVSSSFTIRNVYHKTGFEKSFMFYSPNVLDIKKVGHRRVRRARLYYLRDRPLKESRF